jgi:hypothetical protein
MSHFYQLNPSEIICLDTGVTWIRDYNRILVHIPGLPAEYAINSTVVKDETPSLWQRLLDLCAVSEKQLEYEMLPGLIVDTETLHEKIDRLQPIPGGASVIKTGE